MAGERREGGSATNGIAILIRNGGLRRKNAKKKAKKKDNSGNPKGRRKGMPSQAKSKKILRDGEIGGKELTKRQKGFFGLRAGGGTPTRLRRPTPR